MHKKFLKLPKGISTGSGHKFGHFLGTIIKVSLFNLPGLNVCKDGCCQAEQAMGSLPHILLLP